MGSTVKGGSILKKRLFALIAALSVLLFAVPASAAVQAFNTEAVTLYEAPGYDSSRLMVVPDGSFLFVTKYTDTWAYVVYNTQETRVEGWVFLSLLRFPSTEQQTLGIVISEDVSLREEPSGLSRQLIVFDNGTLFTILGEQDDWYYISYADPDTGIAYQGYLRKSLVVVNPRSITVQYDSTPLLAYPEDDAPQIAALPAGYVLTVIAEYGDFMSSITTRPAASFRAI